METIRIYHDSVVDAQTFVERVRDEGHTVITAVGGRGPWYTEFIPDENQTHYSHEMESY